METILKGVAVEVEGLTHTYGERTALENVSFVVYRGEIFGLLGPNGSGKTTAFRILNTLYAPSRGKVKVFDMDVRRDPLAARRRIGVVFQSSSLDKKLTVLENLRHQGHLYGLYGRTLVDRSHRLLERFQLHDRSNNPVEELSGGMRRRVELAKAFLHDPEILLLDEPTTGLDPGARRELWAYIEELRQQEGTTVLLTTHLMEDAERCERLGILDRGRLIAVDSPASLKEKIGNDVISLETKDPERLKELIRARFGGEPMVLDGRIRMERRQGHTFITQLIEAFPGQIDAVTVRKPNLEDVFIRLTGHKFWQGKQGFSA